MSYSNAASLLDRLSERTVDRSQYIGGLGLSESSERDRLVEEGQRELLATETTVFDLSQKRRVAVIDALTKESLIAVEVLTAKTRVASEEELSEEKKISWKAILAMGALAEEARVVAKALANGIIKTESREEPLGTEKIVTVFAEAKVGALSSLLSEAMAAAELLDGEPPSPLLSSAVESAEEALQISLKAIGLLEAVTFESETIETRALSMAQETTEEAIKALIKTKEKSEIAKEELIRAKEAREREAESSAITKTRVEKEALAAVEILSVEARAAAEVLEKEKARSARAVEEIAEASEVALSETSEALAASAAAEEIKRSIEIIIEKALVIKELTAGSKEIEVKTLIEESKEIEEEALKSAKEASERAISALMTAKEAGGIAV